MCGHAWEIAATNRRLISFLIIILNLNNMFSDFNQKGDEKHIWTTDWGHFLHFAINSLHSINGADRHKQPCCILEQCKTFVNWYYKFRSQRYASIQSHLYWLLVLWCASLRIHYLCFAPPNLRLFPNWQTGLLLNWKHWTGNSFSLMLISKINVFNVFLKGNDWAF